MESKSLIKIYLANIRFGVFDSDIELLRDFEDIKVRLSKLNLSDEDVVNIYCEFLEFVSDGKGKTDDFADGIVEFI